MFSGIVESRAQILEANAEGGLIRVVLARPRELSADADALKIGDSIAVSGICLTVESFTAQTITFALGAETLRITGWSAASLKGREVNVERSLRFGDRVHGHLVAGHVESRGTVTRVQDRGGSVDLDVRAPQEMLPLVWKKGSWAVEGVSLTINDVSGDIVSMCLIPETLKRTTLGFLREGSVVNLEADHMARGLIHFLKQSRSELGAGPENGRARE